MTRRVCLPLIGGAVAALGFWTADRPSAAATQEPDTTQPTSVSLIRLIANPEAFDGKRVRVIGYVRIEHEGHAIYLHREDFVKGLGKNGLWLSANDSAPEGSREGAVNNRYALIEGRFSAKMTGHRGGWSGSIQAITRMEPWDFDRDKK